jgi:glycosyltransferase involved in cell wall biosynthesis
MADRLAVADAVKPSARFLAAEGPTVMQVLPALVTGGVERGTIDMAQALMEAGWRAIVASAGGPMARELERYGAMHVTLPLDTKNPLTMRSNARRLAEIVAEHRVDLLHARSRAPAWSALWASESAGVPMITTFHGTYNAQNMFKRRFNAVMAKGVRVIAISEFIGDHVVSEYGCDPARVRIIPRGVDIRSFDPNVVKPERVVTLLRAWRLPDGLPVIMLPGRLTRWKGQTVLIDAMARLGRRDVVAVLVGADQGRTSYRSELEARISKHGLKGVVRIVDHCSDMPAAYMLADVVVSASTDPEAFGRVVAEAQAMGRPVIVSGHGGAREIVLADETGWLTPPADSTALAEALQTALDLDPASRAELAERAIAHVRERFTKERMCAATLAVYEEVLVEAHPATT